MKYKEYLQRFISIKDFHFLVVHKGGDSYLKCIAGFYKNGTWDIIADGAVGDIYYKLNEERNITVPYKEVINKPTRKVVIYREPFERFVSLYNEKIKCGHLLPSYIENGLTTDSTIEDFIEYTKKSFINDDIEQHIYPISKQFRYQDIDDIVKIEDLDDYLHYHNIETPNMHINTAPIKYDLKDYEPYKSVIMALYADDYDIVKSSKLWCRKKVNDNVIKCCKFGNNMNVDQDFLEILNYYLYKHSPKSILDLGSGNTTLLFNDIKDVTVTSIDDSEEFSVGNANIVNSSINELYSKYDITLNGKYDFVCVDGPYGYKSHTPRLNILDIILRKQLDRDYTIFFHDSMRDGEKRLISLVKKALIDGGYVIKERYFDIITGVTMLTSLEI